MIELSHDSFQKVFFFLFLTDYIMGLIIFDREHGVVGDMRDVWPNARVRKNVSLIRTFHGFKGI